MKNMPKDDLQDAENWLRQQEIADLKHFKRYGTISLALLLAIIAIAGGMPGHFLWKWLGIPFIILFLCAFVPTLICGGRILGQWLTRRG